MKLSQLKFQFNYENLLYSLLFLFPLFSIGVRHWTSTIFSLLILLGLIYYFKASNKDKIILHRYEKWYLWMFGIYFVIFLLSMGLNYPDKFSQTRFGNEIRFLLVIPFYFLLLKNSNSMKYLAYGAVLFIPITFVFCLYEIFLTTDSVFRGVYSQLLTGPLLVIYSTLMLAFFIPKMRRGKFKYYLIAAILILLSLISIIYTQVRAAYIASMVISVLLVLLFFNGKIKYVGVTLVATAIVVLSLTSDSISNRLGIAYKEISSYLNTENTADPKTQNGATSSGVRLEMLRSSVYYLRDHTWIGVGNGNYNKSMKVYVDAGLIHPEANRHGHPHNVFVNAIISRGVLGLLITLVLFFFPLYVYIKTRDKSKSSSNMGILFVTSMLLFSLNESAPLIKSNFLATYLILSLVIFQHHMRQIKSLTTK